MAGRKHTTYQSQLWQRSDTSSSSNSDADPCSSSYTKRAKRQVTVATFEKWQRDFDRLHQTRTWLRCDRGQDRSLLDLLWCDVCRTYEDSIRGMKNFQTAWTAGSANMRTSNESTLTLTALCIERSGTNCNLVQMPLNECY